LDQNKNKPGSLINFDAAPNIQHNMSSVGQKGSKNTLVFLLLLSSFILLFLSLFRYPHQKSIGVP
jgi:hypothetical protein